MTCWGWRSQMIVLMLLRISSMKGITSPTCTWIKWRRHFWAILMKVSHAMSWTPSWVSVRAGQKNKNALELYPSIHPSAWNRCKEGVQQIKILQLTMHELKELVHNSFEELPVGSKKTRVLANNVHDVRGDDGLVVFSSLLLTETQQILKQTPKDSLRLNVKPYGWDNN